MSTKTDYKTALITLAGVATLMDAISIQLEITTGERDDRLDAIRCDIEDFREDLLDGAEVTA